MAEKTAGTVEAPVETASPDKAPAPEPSGKGESVKTVVWAAGKTARREELFGQAIVNTRDAIPVASYDVVCEVTGTSKKQHDKTEGTAWEITVHYAPRTSAPPEPVDLEAVIKEAKAGYGDSHPGDPLFLEPDDNPK